MGTGVIGGVVGGVAAGTRAGRAAAISAFELTPTPEGETAISQAIPTGLAAQVGGAVGARQGAVTGGALGAALTARIFPGPQPEVTLAPGVEVPLPVAGGVLGAAVGGVVGRETGRATAAELLGAAPMAEAPTGITKQARFTVPTTEVRLPARTVAALITSLAPAIEARRPTRIVARIVAAGPTSETRTTRG